MSNLINNLKLVGRMSDGALAGSSVLESALISSSNANIASVSNKKLTINDAGAVKITATLNNVSTSIDLTALYLPDFNYEEMYLYNVRSGEITNEPKWYPGMSVGTVTVFTGNSILFNASTPLPIPISQSGVSSVVWRFDTSDFRTPEVFEHELKLLIGEIELTEIDSSKISCTSSSHSIVNPTILDGTLRLTAVGTGVARIHLKYNDVLKASFDVSVMAK